VDDTSRAISFEELWQRWSPDVFRFALALTRNQAEAEDVTSETFLRVWSSPVPVRMPSVRAWLLTIARNLVLSEARRSWRSQPLPDDLPGTRSLASGIEARLELESVLESMAELPELDRAALVLRFHHDLPYSEIAAVLGLTEQSARARVFRVRVRLAEARERMPKAK